MIVTLDTPLPKEAQLNWSNELVSALINNSVVVGLLLGSGLDGRGFGSSPTHVVAELVSGDAPGDVEGECRRAPPATQQAETILFRRTR